MPRTSRASAGNVCYHVLNRGNARMTVFHKDEDYAAFLKLLGEANERVSMRLLAFCLMPNHFHLVAWPRRDGDLSRWMQWLLTAHVRRYHRHYRSSGHVWQGRFKAFPVESDDHLLTVMRYVERNPIAAKTIPIRKAQNWPWSSAGRPPRGTEPVALDPGPAPRGASWPEWVNQPLDEQELAELQISLERGRPYGGPDWQRSTAGKLGLESTLRPRGRPRKKTQ
ncbi:Transposase IS200 like protein [Pirellulimonas nuda]|uniref:Transposase IS200 like protein n=1 Tax=Pirellulimonas nuda TaxID=2528009 RepID=A0A518DFD6_9BACT|nr:transposase [Pirellulimonas nuda]QDU90193.1 Transposase IS200 like protein [Pirellulimonas nuda]